ncbi:uncharacterized protein N7446_003505 [Penicillium canescens]|uniref:FAD/NAD(P)-binding domain-containing protein n=1 Tax=Penicillium canescens TaxID=5083 RepID=A0AAD6N468_PENCN|nr:uncharacterized protein N7446_003505 [Penicillium canescens]KAJ6027895.1 hypothetical protein N7460_012712 [Penicillium canescens]KAJ6041179.1 hypothetical protein N7444_010084 [Penicillium canescens]KAJ6066468.1 hypothetical protein N7446_003505 [Penicillium canescens]
MDKPLNTNRPVRVVIIGAGASGLLMAYKLQRNFDDLDFIIYEKNPDVGGTWYENRYPGCACDNPSHTYVWSFDPHPTWSSTYASSKEIFDYFKGFHFRFNLSEKTKVGHQVIGAKWDESTAKWNIDIKDRAKHTVIHDLCDVLVNAGGILNAWRWPAIPGLHDFRGKLVHSAAWDESLDLTNKHVGLIGNGSSGIQILPAILPQVSKCTTFIREPSWIAMTGFAGFQPRNFTREEKAKFANDPNALKAFRHWLEHNANKIFPLFLATSPQQTGAHEIFQSSMENTLQDPNLAEKLIPTWAVGCRRLTPGIGYLESLTDQKTQVVYGDIAKISQRGCVTTDDKEYPVDVLICATGFDTTFKPRFPLVGPHGRQLSDDWKDEPRGYFGVAAPGYPNYYMFLGPNSPIGNGPVLSGIEAQADFICKHITRIQQQGIKSIEVTKEAVDEFLAFKDEYMKHTVWREDCRSWYKGNSVDGKIVALWPGSTLHFREALKEVRWDDFHVKYFGNRFNYFGNGMTKIEMTPDADLATYIRKSDDAEIIGSKFTYVKAGLECSEGWDTTALAGTKANL